MPDTIGTKGAAANARRRPRESRQHNSPRRTAARKRFAETPSIGVSKIYAKGNESKIVARKLGPPENGEVLIHALAQEWDLPDIKETKRVAKVLDALRKIGVTDITSASRVSRREAEDARLYLGARERVPSEPADDFPGAMNLIRRLESAAIANGYFGTDLKHRVKTGLDERARKAGFDSYDNVLRFLRDVDGYGTNHLDLDVEPDREFDSLQKVFNSFRSVCRELGTHEIRIGQAMRLRADPGFTVRRTESLKEGGAERNLPIVAYDPQPGSDFWVIRFDPKPQRIFRRGLTTKTG